MCVLECHVMLCFVVNNFMVGMKLYFGSTPLNPLIQIGSVFNRPRKFHLLLGQTRGLVVQCLLSIQRR